MTNVIPFPEILANAEVQQPSWPNPTPLPFTLPDVPVFDPALLPSKLSGYVQDIADRLSIPPDFTAIPAMVAAGSLIGSKFGVRPQAHTPWTEVGNLWGCIVGSPGVMKSPALGEILGPVRRLDARAESYFANAQLKHEDEMAVYKLARDTAEKRAKKALGNDDHFTALDHLSSVVEPDAPRAERYLVTDATVEKLGEICADNPRGVLQVRDELLTLLSDLDAPEKATARGFMMTGWNGQDSYSFDRIGRGTIRIPRVNISLMGTTQPQKLSAYMRKALDEKGDGMVQRLQLLAYPDIPRDWENVDRPVDLPAMEQAYGCYDELAGLTADMVGAERDPFDNGDGIPFLRFVPEGIERFLDYRTRLERLVRGDELQPALIEHLSKYRGLIPRLALICHVASGGTGLVSATAVEQAIGWAAYLEAHARRAYGSLAVDNGEAARAIWRRVEKGDIADGFTERDIYIKGWSNLKKGDRLTAALKLLVECNWLAETKLVTGGRPSVVFHINPLALNRPALAA